jgi:hypothetical protein
VNDPYFDTIKCAERLKKEYDTHKKLIVAVDFDDTVFDFHNQGHNYLQVVTLLRRCQKLGFYIVMFTGSHPDKWLTQAEYLKNLGVKIICVNENPIPLPFGNNGKMYYNILLDDRAGLYQAYTVLDIVVSQIEEGL